MFFYFQVNCFLQTFISLIIKYIMQITQVVYGLYYLLFCILHLFRETEKGPKNAQLRHFSSILYPTFQNSTAPSEAILGENTPKYDI